MCGVCVHTCMCVHVFMRVCVCVCVCVCIYKISPHSEPSISVVYITLVAIHARQQQARER